ncbi:MAG TPA: hypothetical protein VJK52_04645 [Candidatus Nanoarchaeia archaeon]|nr:hypothetical protein [Candidatus Nanoarchaeia archaeon]
MRFGGITGTALLLALSASAQTQKEPNYLNYWNLPCDQGLEGAMAHIDTTLSIVTEENEETCKLEFGGIVRVLNDQDSRLRILHTSPVRKGAVPLECCASGIQTTISRDLFCKMESRYVRKLKYDAAMREKIARSDYTPKN